MYLPLQRRTIAKAMPSYDRSALWQRSLAAKEPDPYSKERDCLRRAYEELRERVIPLAEAIAASFPHLTVHDITHSDALWELADCIAGPTYPLNPCESFVLGGAFLIHDLGMGLLAWKEGLCGLKKEPLWKDTVVRFLREDGITEAEEELINNPPESVEKRTLFEVVRHLHAQRAETLALDCWTIPANGQQFYLIEKPELRDAFGPMIGRVAHSHWWSIERLGEEFEIVNGSPSNFPPDWTVDLLKVACILRLADFSHIDGSRALAYLRALRRPTGDAEIHWEFQNKLNQPWREGDRLVYTAKSGFNIDKSRAWWLCFDWLHAFDSELRKVDSLLADKRRERVEVKGVAQVEEPSRLAKKFIKTEGWKPVDTQIRISKVADIVSKLGGKELYGGGTEVPLRELLQNSADAIRARRVMDGKDSEWGEIYVRSGEDKLGSWIEIEDSGVGMSETVLIGPFLDFGVSFWGSALMHEELPGLGAKGFHSIGRYGIGFFSIFMWSERVHVFTRRYDKAREDTLVLSFENGLKERPLLRKANPDERMPDGGTRIKAWLNEETQRGGYATNDGRNALGLTQLCAYVAPCLDVTIKAREYDAAIETAVVANEWMRMDQESFRTRILLGSPGRHRVRNPLLSYQIIRGIGGQVLGRAALSAEMTAFEDHDFDVGIITVGGFRSCALSGISGVLVGSPIRAARDVAVPLVPYPILKEWAESQRERYVREECPMETKCGIGVVLQSLGLQPTGLPVALNNSGWRTCEQIAEDASLFEEFLLAGSTIIGLEIGLNNKAELNANVLITFNTSNICVQSGGNVDWPPRRDWKSVYRDFYPNTLQAAVIEALANGWQCTMLEVLEASTPRAEPRVIGAFSGRPVKVDVDVIRKPTRKRDVIHAT